MDYTVKIGGAAGQGVLTVGEVLSEVFARTGFHVFTSQDYESRVRGGHNFYQIRLSDRRVFSSSHTADIIIALDNATRELHEAELTEKGVLAYDSESLKISYEGSNMIDVPFKGLAREEAGNPIMENIVAVGAVLGLLGMSTEAVEVLIKERFLKKGAEIVEGNIRAVQAGNTYARANCTECSFVPAQASARKRLISGHEAAAIGALSGGLSFYSAYPMTPSTGVMNEIANRSQELGVIVEQAEDEISAINMALGASFAGARAATGSSGGGFALMVEGVSLAAMTETPIVIFEAMRPGPATGLPTRTEQSDLLFILSAGHGEFPRVVLAPGSPEQLVLLTNKAFDLAEKFQIPVFVLYDQYLGDSQWTYEAMDTNKLVYNEHRVRGDEARALEGYRRYALTDSGVSPLLNPGDGHEHLVVVDSDEHDEDGHIVEDIKTRVAMVEKRLHKKMENIRAEISPPIEYGVRDAQTVLVGWGSMYGLLREAVDSLIMHNERVSMLYFNEIAPLPEPSNYMHLLENASKTVCIEANATGQFARYLKSETGFEFSHHINRYDGRPFSINDILDGI